LDNLNTEAFATTLRGSQTFETSAEIEITPASKSTASGLSLVISPRGTEGRMPPKRQSAK